MKTINELQDDEYPFNGIKEVRIIARGIILNDKNEVALIHILGDDIFGHRDYYETSGGGVNQDELLTDAVKREIKEETGLIVEVIQELGMVKDYYNLIKRENHSYYYLVKVVGQDHTQLEDYEKELFDGVHWFTIDEAIKVMENQDNFGVSKLVKERELPILRIAKQLIK